MPEHDDLACQDLVEAVTCYLEGALPPVERSRIEAHLDGCPGCITYIEQVHRTTELVARAAAMRLSDSTREELLRAFRVSRAGSGT